MDLVKKNIPILICVVIALGAIVADFIPLGGLRDELRDKAQARAGEYSALDSLLNKTRQLPVVDPTQPEPQPLGAFPTDAVIENGRIVTEQLAASSDALLENVIRRTERKPLVEGALPSPQFVQSDAFKRAYQRITDLSVRGRANSLPVTVMKAGFAPTPEDIEREAIRIRDNIQATMAIVANGVVTNQEQVNAAIAAQQSTLQDRMVREAAENCLIYINPEALDVQQGVVAATGQLEPSVIFWAQLGLWVQEDLYAGIRQIIETAGARNVGESPIKHLLAVSVINRFIGIDPTASADPNNPMPPPSNDPNAPLTPNYQVSPSGRASNGLYDVVHMRASMVVEADKLPMVLDQLGRGRLLSVVQVERVEPVDPAAAANAGYFYGDKPCVRVDLLVEDLLLRKWTVQYMPERVKQMLGVVPAPPPGE
jgi:hypothetical protein